MNDVWTEGLKVRVDILGKEYVDQAIGRDDPFNRPLQEWITRSVWGGIWTRQDLPPQMRSLVVLAILTALDRPKELALHPEGAIRNGCSLEQIREVLPQCAAYCGAPVAIDAMKVSNEVLADEIAQGKASSS